MIVNLRKLLRDLREARIRKINRRILYLNDCLAGTDEDIWPGLVREYESERQRLAFKRVELLQKVQEA